MTECWSSSLCEGCRLDFLFPSADPVGKCIEYATKTQTEEKLGDTWLNNHCGTLICKRDEQAITLGKWLRGSCDQRRGTTKEEEVTTEEKQLFCEQEEIKVIYSQTILSALHECSFLKCPFTSFLAFFSVATDETWIKSLLRDREE